jgi:hypothetical protein
MRRILISITYGRSIAQKTLPCDLSSQLLGHLKGQWWRGKVVRAGRMACATRLRLMPDSFFEVCFLARAQRTAGSFL